MTKKTPGKSKRPKKKSDLLKDIFANTTEEKAALREAREFGLFPDAFTPVFEYKQIEASEIFIRPGILWLDVDEHTQLKFEVKDFKPRNIPALPLVAWGHVIGIMFQVDQFWAVDANGRSWLDKDHYGDALEPCTRRQMVSALKHNEEAITKLHKCFGWKPVLPSWFGKALSARWDPPIGFDMSYYVAYNWKK